MTDPTPAGETMAESYENPTRDIAAVFQRLSDYVSLIDIYDGRFPIRQRDFSDAQEWLSRWNPSAPPRLRRGEKTSGADRGDS